MRELKKKDVVNLKDGRKLGRVYDIVFLYPEGRVLGIVVPGSKRCFFFSKEAVFIDMAHIAKIGEDTILVEAFYPSEPPKKGGYCPPSDRREPPPEPNGPPRHGWDGVE